ncbi:hypothetical protein F5X98DRAFT_331152 [Xylaria grammica]|nr:hypothetical protein F5X98DRAFT_331152 [Xylaria grammica]
MSEETLLSKWRCCDALLRSRIQIAGGRRPIPKKIIVATVERRLENAKDLVDLVRSVPRKTARLATVDYMVGRPTLPIGDS